MECDVVLPTSDFTIGANQRALGRAGGWSHESDAAATGIIQPHELVRYLDQFIRHFRVGVDRRRGRLGCQSVLSDRFALTNAAHSLNFALVIMRHYSMMPTIQVKAYEPIQIFLSEMR